MEEQKELFSPSLAEAKCMPLAEYASGELVVEKSMLIFYFQLRYLEFEWSITRIFDDFASFSKKLSKLPGIKPNLLKKKNFQILTPEAQLNILSKYLTELFLIIDLCQSDVVREFLDTSYMSFRGIICKRKEGYVKKQTGGRAGNDSKVCNCNKHFKRFQKRWMMIRDTGVFVSKNKETEKMSDILMYDSKFSISFSRDTGYSDGMLIINAKRKLLIRAGSILKLLEWKRAIESALNASEYIQNDKRFGSLFPPRRSNYVKLFVDGENYFRKIYQALKKAKSQVFITDWWLSPDMYLKRPAQKHPKSKLVDVLDRIASKGVSVYVHVYKELASALTLNSRYSIEALRLKNPAIRAIRHPKRSIYGGEFLWSHHEKIVCIDQEVAFLGGLDLCYGRMDNQKHKLQDISSKPFWNGIDYSNSRVKDFTDVHNWERDIIDRNVTPRMPWHDLAVMVKGDAAYDVSMHYIELWNHVMTDFSGGYLKNKDLLTPLHPKTHSESSSKKNSTRSLVKQGVDIDLFTLDEVVSDKSEVELMRNRQELKDRRKSFNMTMEEEIKESQYSIRGSLVKSGRVGSCNCQIVRSAGLWSYGLESTDHSIRTAYLELIDKAQHFIYIENQFFISSTSGSLVQNKIAQALAEKIIAKASRKEPFKVIVVLPLLPGFAGDVDAGSSAVLRIQMHWQYQTIIRAENSLYGLLRKSEFISNPEDHIRFYGLRNHDQLRDSPVTEIVYVHSKMMIIDDDEMIIGSANINDRSMVGEHDSEIAVVISDSNKIDSVLDGANVLVSKTVFDFRMKIFNEFLGECKQKDIVDVLSESFRKEWEGTAYNNTQKYKAVFGCYPDDDMTTYESIKKLQREAKINLYPRIKKEFKGFLVEFPLHFLEQENLMFSVMSVENLLPEKSFI